MGLTTRPLDKLDGSTTQQAQRLDGHQGSIVGKAMAAAAARRRQGRPVWPWQQHGITGSSSMAGITAAVWQRWQLGSSTAAAAVAAWQGGSGSSIGSALVALQQHGSNSLVAVAAAWRR
jgi:hypothetical protein